jgi:K+-transporting ATPase ATPase C chain
MLKTILISVKVTLVLALLTGLVFPLVMTAVAQAIFPDKANGSLVSVNGKVVGSALIAQRFVSDKYFHPRPSLAGSGYAGEASSGSNLGPTSKKLFEGIADDPKTKDVDESFAGVKQLAESYRHENGLVADALVPVDAVTRSGSGLDPDISLENARLQAPRIAKARQMPVVTLLNEIDRRKTDRQIGLLGEPRVNVLLLNLHLDSLAR